MAETASTTRRKPTKARARKTQTTRTQTQTAPQGPAEVAYTRARQAAESVVDVPVGTALLVADRVNGLVEPWTKRTSAERELKTHRTQVRRELNRVERRGGT